MTDTLPEGTRVKIVLNGVVDYDDGGEFVQLRIIRHEAFSGLNEIMTVARKQITATLAPIQRPGAAVYHVGHDQVAYVVLHDDQAGEYVVRGTNGKLVVWKDDSDVQPHPDALTAPHADEEAERLLAQSVPEPFPPAHGPNCKHTYMDASCDAEGCLGEIPF